MRPKRLLVPMGDSAKNRCGAFWSLWESKQKIRFFHLTALSDTLSIADGEGAERRVGRKTASVVYPHVVETPLYVRRDLKRILWEEKKGPM
jgi:hypothetical protein